MKGLVNCSLFNNTDWHGNAVSIADGARCVYDAKITDGASGTHQALVLTNPLYDSCYGSSDCSPYPNLFAVDARCQDLSFFFNMSVCKVDAVAEPVAAHAAFSGQLEGVIGTHIDEFDHLRDFRGNLTYCNDTYPGFCANNHSGLSLMIDSEYGAGASYQAVEFSYKEATINPFSCDLLYKSLWSGSASVGGVQYDAEWSYAAYTGSYSLQLYNPSKPVGYYSSMDVYLDFDHSSCKRAGSDNGNSKLYGAVPYIYGYAGTGSTRIDQFAATLMQCNGEAICAGQPQNSWVLSLLAGNSDITIKESDLLNVMLFQGLEPADEIPSPIGLYFGIAFAALAAIFGFSCLIACLCRGAISCPDPKPSNGARRQVGGGSRQRLLDEKQSDAVPPGDESPDNQGRNESTGSLFASIVGVA